ncbi:carboxymuconolactone decarboxylase family protein [Comamonas sp. BIGb0124]|uniref:carboxymuconolactone decarboxylase family protein n=1 Tax=Comamonas sp. BIGb0124 TaxID=2485130 RepID=UPI000FACDB31|nr:carboxymuconolactone decarboxylase family protein [Comamonas sp. BIGb0124]ROR24684.1 carboxymuconolactone decarboxylase family protein [Comamonas sp. BIGb0124]
MNNTHLVKRGVAAAMLATLSLAAEADGSTPGTRPGAASAAGHAAAGEALTQQQQHIVPVSALAAAGDMARLGPALQEALNAGVTVNELKEVLTQLYAYAGFPRSLNALAELMKVVEQRRGQGIVDDEGRLPSRPIPTGDALLKAGTANQTRLVGAPVGGALFDFAPAAGTYLQTHLFGDIFERDNLDWKSRELATVAMLSTMAGAQAQLQSHMNMSMNVGLTEGQLTRVAQLLGERVDDVYGQRARTALARHLESRRSGG